MSAKYKRYVRWLTAATVVAAIGFVYYRGRELAQQHASRNGHVDADQVARADRVIA
jgi:hypothetical protein